MQFPFCEVDLFKMHLKLIGYMPFLVISLKSSLHVSVNHSAVCYCVLMDTEPLDALQEYQCHSWLLPFFLGKVCRSVCTIFASFAAVVSSLSLLSCFKQMLSSTCTSYITNHSDRMWVNVNVIHAVQWAFIGLLQDKRQMLYSTINSPPYFLIACILGWWYGSCFSLNETQLLKKRFQDFRKDC